MAGGAISALAGLREEIEALARARIDEAIRRLDLVKREELDAMAELAANARAGQEAAGGAARMMSSSGLPRWRRASRRWRRRKMPGEACGAARCLGRLGFVVNAVP